MKVLLRSDSWCGRVAYLHFLFTSNHQLAILFRKRFQLDALAAGGRGERFSGELTPTYLYQKYPSLCTAIQEYYTRMGVKNFLTDGKSQTAASSFFSAMKRRIRESLEVQVEIDNEVLFDTTVVTADTTDDDKVVVGVTDETKIKEMFEALNDADLEVAAAGFNATEEEEEEEEEEESTDDEDEDAGNGEESNKKMGRWNQMEQAQFQEGLDQYGDNLAKIADVIPTRKLYQVRYYYECYFQQNYARTGRSSTATTTKATTGGDYFQWNEEDHKEFVQLLEVYGNGWTQIAAHMNRNRKHRRVTTKQVGTHARNVHFRRLKQEDATHGTHLYQELETRLAAIGKVVRRRTVVTAATGTAAAAAATGTVSEDNNEDDDAASSYHRATDGGTKTAAVVVTRATVGSTGSAIGAGTGAAANVKSKATTNNTHGHGTKILKKFLGKPFRGWIVSHDSSSSPLTYNVEYEDGDKEELTHHEVTTLLSSYEATIPELQAQQRQRRRELYPPYTKILREPYRGWVTQYQDPYYAVEYENGDSEDLRPEQVTKYLCEYHENIADIQQSNSSGPGGQRGQGRGKSKQVLQREQRLSNKRERERTQNSFNDNDKLQQQQPPPHLPQQQQKKKKSKKTITNRKNTTTNDVVHNNNNDEIMLPVSSSPLASMAPSAPAKSDESSESESVMRSVSSETQQLPSTTSVAVGTAAASTVLVHEKHATTARTATTALLSSSPVAAAVLATDSLRRTMEGSNNTPATTTRTASAVVRRAATAPMTSISYPLVQPSPASSPPIAPASVSANNNTIQSKHDSFRFHGQDKLRFNTLFTVELEYIHNRKNGERNQMNFAGIAAMMKCEIQQVMSHFYQSGREHEIKKGYI